MGSGKSHGMIRDVEQMSGKRLQPDSLFKLVQVFPNGCHSGNHQFIPLQKILSFSIMGVKLLPPEAAVCLYRCVAGGPRN